MTKTIDTRPLGQELEQAALDPGRKGIIDLIQRHSDALQNLLGDKLTVEEFKSATMTYLRLNRTLVECNPYSIVGGLRLGAQLGLSLGPLGHFYLVPFKQEAVFILGYKGMVELAYRSGKVKRVEAHVVRQGDDFSYRYGSRAFLDFTPADGADERDRTGVYALAELTTGGKAFVVLSPSEVAARMKRSPSHTHTSSPWQTNTDAMWRKSAVRALQPWLPQTPEQSAGLAQDEAVVDALADEPGDVPTDEDGGS